MKPINEYMPSINVRAQAPSVQPRKPVDLSTLAPEVQAMFNGIFRQLRIIFPAWRQTLKSQEDADEYRRQLVLALIEANITHMTQLDAGLVHARKLATPYLPGPGQFVTWCQESSLAMVGFPTVDEAIAEFSRYRNNGYLYKQPADFPWSHPVLYWVVLGLIKAKARQMTDVELRRNAESILSEWGKRVLLGGEIPAPVALIEDNTRQPCQAEQMGKQEKYRAIGEAFRRRAQSKIAADHCDINQTKKVSK